MKSVWPALVDEFGWREECLWSCSSRIGIFAFLLTWILPEIELRTTTGAVDSAETFAMPAERSSLDEIQREITVLENGEDRHKMYADLARRAGLELGPRACWLLYRFDDRPDSTLTEIADIVGRPADMISALADGLHHKGLLTEDRDRPGHRLALSAAGRDAISRLLDARRDRLEELLGDWSPQDNPELVDEVRKLASVLMADDKMLESATPRTAGTPSA